MTDNRLIRIETITKQIEIELTFHEIKKLFIEKSPTEIFVIPYSSSKPCISISKPILEGDTEICIIYESHHNKNQYFVTWTSFYTILKKYGLSNIRF